MSDLNNNQKSFNLPTYLHIPFFLYQDSRLEKSSMLIAAFFYSIHTSGQKITASPQYLCALANVNTRQFYKIMNLLEQCNYITRTGFTNRSKIKWSYNPKSEIIVDESNTTALDDTTVQEQNTTALQDTKLVHSRTLNLCTPVHTYTKDDIKDNKTTTTEQPPPSSSSFFSEKQKEELLSYKLKTDTRSDELFLENCQFHIEKQDNEKTKYQRFSGLKNILSKLNEFNEPFNASGFNKNIESKEISNKIPTKEDFDNYKKCISGFEWVGRWMQQQA